MYTKKKGSLFDLGRQMQEIVDRAFRQAMFADPVRGSSWMPLVDIAETTDAVHVVLEVPGVLREDVEVSFEEGLLSIRGRRREFLPAGVCRYHHIEIDRGTFARVLQIPPGFRMEEAQANLRDGLLHIVLPKQAVHGKRVEVERIADEEE